MTPERWREIERLYHAALERDAVERAAFLNDACGGDEALRREVESLFVYQTKAKDFIEAPAVKVRSRGTVARAERRFAHSASLRARADLSDASSASYEVQALIAAGGMGEVYRAVDTRLNRTVAIKMLPEHVSNDPERRGALQARSEHRLQPESSAHLHALRRRESRTASTTWSWSTSTARRSSTGWSGDRCHWLARSNTPSRSSTRFDKAHRRGRHTPRLEARERHADEVGREAARLRSGHVGAPAAVLRTFRTRRDTRRLTAEGTILGTLQYMSPEQLEGKQADVRTDIFAFGAVVYEMITGRRRCDGPSQAELVGAILKDDAQPIGELVPQTYRCPLAQALARCLSKDPDDRWQTASDLLFQLRSYRTHFADG